MPTLNEDFEAGVIFAMGLLKEQLLAREDTIRAACNALPREEGSILNSAANVLHSVRNTFETEALKRMNAMRTKGKATK